MNAADDGHICEPLDVPASCDESKGDLARLMDLQIASSFSSASVGSPYSGHGSAKMVEVALLGGARCLHFAVTTKAESGRIIPVVDFGLNYVSLYDCLDTLHRAIVYKAVHPYVVEGFRSDPIIIHLELNVLSQMLVMDQML